jgi:hypothetical protein
MTWTGTTPSRRALKTFSPRADHGELEGCQGSLENLELGEKQFFHTVWHSGNGTLSQGQGLL